MTSALIEPSESERRDEPAHIARRQESLPLATAERLHVEVVRPPPPRDTLALVRVDADVRRVGEPLGIDSLALRARGGDGSAKQKLVQHSLAFVVTMAAKQRRGSVRLDDLVQEGNLGLLRAVEKFDPDAGTRFLTYAAWWIRAYIGRYLMAARSTVRPRSGTLAQPDFSHDKAIGEDEDLTCVERIEDEGPSPEDTCLSADGDREVRDALSRARRHIGKLGWDIVQNRLQLESPMTLQEIGARWGISRERVRQVEVRTKQILQRHLDALKRIAPRDAA